MTIQNRRIISNPTYSLIKRHYKFFLLLCLFGLLYSILLFTNSTSITIRNDVNVDKEENHINHTFISSHKLFLIEPSLLLQFDQEAYANWFPTKKLQFSRDDKILTFGTFQTDLKFDNYENISYVDTLFGRSPFLSRNLPIHHFVQGATEIIHIVVFHKFENFFWVGGINDELKSHLFKANNITLNYFGNFEQIFDPFNVTKIEHSIYHHPSEIGHFLGQIETSRYLHCTEESLEWSKKYNVPYDALKAKYLYQSVKSMKDFMKELQFEFWIFCGTLLGWYRQCSVIPYTTDADYATWAGSMNGKNITGLMFEKSRKHGLKLFYRFGEPSMTQEYSFKNTMQTFKTDLFFIYPNSTNFRLPWHVASKKQWTYSVYPKFELCSTVLLSYKVLVPCTPEDVIRTEYLDSWNVPITEDKFDWILSPPNVEPFKDFNFSVSQFSQY